MSDELLLAERRQVEERLATSRTSEVHALTSYVLACLSAAGVRFSRGAQTHEMFEGCIADLLSDGHLRI